MDQLRITEIFYSLQGEAATVGLPTIFIRLTGCPLRCGYCDTAYAFSGGQLMSLKEIMETVKRWKTPYVTVTGGEPLAQPQVKSLLTQLCDANYQVSLETSGAMDIAEVDERVGIVMDLKTPGSGESSRNLYENCYYLGISDQVKFVICDRSDYDWAKFKADELKLSEQVGEVLFSASHEQLAHAELAQWMLTDQLPYRFQVQLHKWLWNDEPGR